MNLRSVDDFFLLNKKGKFTALDGVRGWAVFMVFMLHFAPAAQVYFGQESQWRSGLQFINNVFRYTPFFGTNGGNLGVDLFFILSGFLIFGSIHRRKPSFISFITNRYKRLLPAHLLVIMSSLTVTPFLGILTNVFLLALFFPQLGNANFVTWALSYEMLFYVMCGVWFIWGAKIKELHTWRFLIFASIVFLVSHKPIADFLTSISMQYVERDRFIAFFLGLGLGKIHYENKIDRKKLENLFHNAAIPALIIMAAIKLVWDNPMFKVFGQYERTMQFAIFDSASVMLVGAILFAPQSFVHKIFNLKPLRILGAVSYSFFLSHAIWGVAIGARISDYLLPGGGGYKIILYFIVTLFTTFIISTFMFHFLEKPYYAKK